MDAKKAVENYRQILADTFVLYMKTYAVHWNYTGTNFFSVHKLTEEQYGELAETVDELAERIRALGHDAPISLSSILKSADIKEIGADEDVQTMLRELTEGHRELSKRAKAAADALDEADDDFGNDFMVARIGAHDKAAWMLGSLLRK